jgi:hypothetical protein
MIRFILLLLCCLPITAHAQLKECAVLYKEYKDNQTNNPTVAYQSAKEFLKRCPNKDPNVKKFIDALEKAAYEPQPSSSTKLHRFRVVSRFRSGKSGRPGKSNA